MKLLRSAPPNTATRPISQRADGSVREHLPTTGMPRAHPPAASRWFARRRLVIILTKWLLPLGAAALLAMIAFWSEFDHAPDKARFTIGSVSGDIDGARLKDAKYHGVDEKGQPYTITAAYARQLDGDRMELSEPKGDLTQESGTWLMLKARHGRFEQKTNQLELWEEVSLYRDDGTTLTTARAAVDIKAGTALGTEPVHVEGPFGRLDAQGFTLTEKGSAISFLGETHVVLDGTAP
jgi:lipopolysaccharide export system protein LptC